METNNIVDEVKELLSAYMENNIWRYAFDGDCEQQDYFELGFIEGVKAHIKHEVSDG